MNRTVTLTIGILLTIIASFTGLVLVPNWQFRDLKPIVDDDGVAHPAPYYGNIAKGREAYIDLGCIYCHSQQVRTASFGADIDRGWGSRRSVARDYIYDKPPLMGTMRTGPDLANIGARQSSSEWHYLHLYNPQITSPGSIMPPHPFLFEKHEGKDLPSGAVALPGKFSPEPAYIIPKAKAQMLVEYLKSLDHGYQVPEAK